MKKLFISMIMMIGLMIAGTNSVQSQVDSISEWKVITACIHDSQDQHMYDVDVSKSYNIVINVESNVMSINDPQEARKYFLTGPKDSRRGSGVIQWFFDAVDNKGAECQISVILYVERGVVKINISVKYPNAVLYWTAVSVPQEPKIEA
jgi:hypothetical protein